MIDRNKLYKLTGKEYQFYIKKYMISIGEREPMPSEYKTESEYKKDLSLYCSRLKDKSYKMPKPENYKNYNEWVLQFEKWENQNTI